MSHPSKEAVKVAEKFIRKESSQSPLVVIGMTAYDRWRGRRITTDGKNILSYNWWNIGFWQDGDIWITTDQYQTGEWPKSGKPKYSPTTNGHIAAVVGEARYAGYYPTGEEKTIKGRYEDRTYERYSKN